MIKERKIRDNPNSFIHIPEAFTVLVTESNVKENIRELKVSSNSNLLTQTVLIVLVQRIPSSCHVPVAEEL